MELQVACQGRVTRLQGYVRREYMNGKIMLFVMVCIRNGECCCHGGMGCVNLDKALLM